MKITTMVAGDYLLARLERAPLAYLAATAEGMEQVAEYLYDRVYDKLSGEALQIRSGQLRDALEKRVVTHGDKITAQIYIEGVPYARIQERGGQTSPHVIEVKDAEALRFEMAGGVVFAMRVHHPGSRIPASMYMRSVLLEEQAEVRSMIRSIEKKVQT